MIKVKNKHYLLLHLIVFIWGLTPLLGRFINAGAFQLVWFRIAVTVFAMFIYLMVTKQMMFSGHKFNKKFIMD